MGTLLYSKKWLAALFVVAELSHAIKVRMDCYPDGESTPPKCEERGCIWAPSVEVTAPACILKNEDFGYTHEKTEGSVITLKKKEGSKNPWSEDIEQIQLKSDNIGKTLNVKIYVEGRYEPPVDFPRDPSKSADSLEFVTGAKNDSFYFVVKRKSTGTHLFDTSIGGLIFADKFLQIATYLPSDAMYGWGENAHQTLKHDFTVYRTWGMWARDEPPYSKELNTKNLYGVHPFYMVLEPDGKAHGVLILNSNAQEVTTAPGPAIIYRTIGGNLDLYFFPGPTPEEVTQQYLSLIGKPFLPAYWALGFQLSRYGYKDLNDLKATIERNMKAGVPLETVVVDIDFMDRYKMFTVGKTFEGLAEYLKEVQSWGMRVVLLYDPAIQVDDEPFARGLKMKARFIEWEREDQVQRSIQDLYPLVKDTKIMLGVVWPDRHVAFPDFLDPTDATKNWWIQEIVNFHKKVPHDGIWIDMNEPAAFGTNEEYPWYFQMADHPNIKPLWCPTNNSTDRQWEVPPFQTHAVYHYKHKTLLASKTLCMTAVQADGKQRFYNVKNLYGWSEARITQQALHAAMGKRGLMVSRSTFPSAGRYTGHWLGDNYANWEDLRTSIIGAMEFNMFGIPFIGADICGFFLKTMEELCLRWQQLGAFHPFMRNHNTKGEAPQDPALWPSVAEAAKKATFFRYRYLPYLFSLHFIASMEGGTVIRPLFYEYPKDNHTHSLDHQFLWGRSMLIAPVLHEDANSVEVYLPKDDWYSLYDFKYGEACESGIREYPAPLTSLIPVFVRGGSILPRQAANTTTSASRKNAFELLIAPATSGEKKDKAEGVLYWDDGESVVESFAVHNYYHWTFEYHMNDKEAQLTITTKRQAKDLVVPTLDIIEILHYEHFADLNSFKLSDKKVDANAGTSHYDEKKKILYISVPNFINISTGGTINLSWNHSKSKTKEPEHKEPGTKKEEPKKDKDKKGEQLRVRVMEENLWKKRIDIYNP